MSFKRLCALNKQKYSRILTFGAKIKPRIQEHLITCCLCENVERYLKLAITKDSKNLKIQ